LEIGCGIATIVPHLPHSIEYAGIDISDVALNRAVDKYAFPNGSIAEERWISCS